MVMTIVVSGADFHDLAFENFERLLNQGIVFEIVLVEWHGGWFCRSGGRGDGGRFSRRGCGRLWLGGGNRRGGCFDNCGCVMCGALCFYEFNLRVVMAQLS